MAGRTTYANEISTRTEGREGAMIKPITPLPGPNDRYSFLAIDQNKNGVKLKLHRSVDFGEVSNFRNGRESVGKYQLFESGTQYAFKYLDFNF